jgi:hypothetical protein
MNLYQTVPAIKKYATNIPVKKKSSVFLYWPTDTGHLPSTVSRPAKKQGPVFNDISSILCLNITTLV